MVTIRIVFYGVDYITNDLDEDFFKWWNSIDEINKIQFIGV